MKRDDYTVEVWTYFMTMLEYTSPPIWLNAHAQDPRLTVGEYTYFDRHISLALFTPNDRIAIGKFCSLAKDVVIFGGGNHMMTRATTFLEPALSRSCNFPQTIVS